MLLNTENGAVVLKSGKMDYVRFGSGEKNMILLPGLSDGLATVRGKALLLSAPYRKYLKDFTVFMFSRVDPLPSAYSIRDMARDQAEALKKLGLEKISVLGVSQGGMVAQYLAIDNPEVVERLVIAVSAPCVNDVLESCIGRWAGYAEKGDHKALMIDTAENSYSETYLKKYRKLYPVIGAMGKPSDYGRFLANADSILSFDATDELTEIKCPVLIIGAEDDRIVGSDASRKLHELIPGSELYIYPGLGHAAYEEAPDFNERVFAFMKDK